jgi:hypothetical protein
MQGVPTRPDGVWRSTRVITRSGVAADHRADFGGRLANPVFMLSDARPWPSVPGSARRSLIGAVAGVYPVPHMAGLADPSHHPVPLHRAGSPRSGSPPVLVEQTAEAISTLHLAAEGDSSMLFLGCRAIGVAGSSESLRLSTRIVISTASTAVSI